MNNDDLIDLLKENPDTNFIGMAITPLQAIGVDAAVMYLSSKGIRVNGFILITAHPKTGKSINRSNFSSELPDLTYLDYEYTFKQRKTLLEQLYIKNKVLNSTKSKGKEDLYFIWTETVSNVMYVINTALPNKKMNLIRIDDGSGSYISKAYLKFSYLRFDHASFFRIPSVFLKSALYGYAIKRSERLLRSNNSFIDASIFRVKEERGELIFSPNSEFVEYYNESFRKTINNQSDLRIFEDAIVINTQPLKESGMTNGQIELQLYQELNTILKNINHRVILKPHPRELDIERYMGLGWRVFKKYGVSQESIFASIKKKPLCLISICSSTLLNAYGLSNIPAISLARIMLKEQIPNALRKELQIYIRNYKSIILFPESFQELETYLLNACQENSKFKDE